MTEPQMVVAFKQNVAAISTNLQADFVVITGPMQWPADDKLISAMRVHAATGKKKPNVFLLLTTYGGSADVAYRMARCLRQHYAKVIIFVDSVCKSAGTLLALSGNELVISDAGQLGPLDVQIRKPDELGAQVSGLTPVQALEFLREKAFEYFEYSFLEVQARSAGQITTKTASEIATRLTTGLFGGIYSQLDPIALGEYHQNMKIAMEYGRRLDAGNLKRGALDALIYDYPSHDFVIDRADATELFDCVRKPSTEEQALADTVRQEVANDLKDLNQRGAPARIRIVAVDEAGKESDNAASPTT